MEHEYSNKSCLMVATAAAMLVEFNIPIIEQLQAMGVHVSVACNFYRGNTCPDEKINAFRKYLQEKKIPYYQIDFPRTPFTRDIFRGYSQLRRLLRDTHFDLIHTHTPNASALCRLAAQNIRKNGGKVMYTAHGFYFFKKSSLYNWLVFYPIEKLLSYRTDMLITINQCDYTLAKNKMHAKQTHYIPGVGVDVERFARCKINRQQRREALGIGEEDLVVLSVGELSVRKNHKVVIQALGKLKRKHIHYIVAGQGETASYLTQLAQEQGVALHLLGYCNAIEEIYALADIFCFPSLREGLGLAAIEAMAQGLPIITSDVQGIVDYAQDGVTGYICKPKDVDGFASAIATLMDNPTLRHTMGEGNRGRAKAFDQSLIEAKMEQLYEYLLS